MDDHAMVREGLRSVLLVQPDIEVVGEATDGETAVELALKLTLDVILMDLVMPGMSGVNAIRQIKQHKSNAKVLVLTSTLQDEWVKKALQAGAHGYILKASRTADLVDAIRRVAKGQSALDPEVTQAMVRQMHEQDGIETLTSREREVFDLLARGYSSLEIAEKLSIGEATVRTHTASVLDKLRLRDRVQLMVYAVKRGLVQADDLP
jgi:two-component system, NarL family, response regulator LiaR